MMLSSIIKVSRLYSKFACFSIDYIHHRWASGHFLPSFDTHQDLENTEINLQDGGITMSFRRALVYDNVPVSFISNNVQEDLNLNQCVYVLRAGGGSVSNYTSPAIFSVHNFQGVFDRQLCLQGCGGRYKYYLFCYFDGSYSWW